ncbi:MAG: phosphatidate cytidylyltransferase [Actinomycetota bacterium]
MESEGPRRHRRFLEDADRIFGDDSAEVEPVFGERGPEEGESFEDEPFAPEQPPEPEAPRRRRGPTGETLKRVLVAIPWIAFAIFITAVGGPVFMAAMIGLGVIGLREYFLIVRDYRPIQPAAFLAVPAMIAAAHYGNSFHVLMVAVASFPLLFAFGANRQHRKGITTSMGVTLLGVVWIGLPLVYAVLLRDLPLHGAALLINVLVGTFVTDTAAYATGRLFGSRRISPRLSPNKTLEGLIGGFIIGTMAFWFAGLYQDWLTGIDALIMGACVAALAPVGDLFESMLKRDLGVKDTGSIFGPHGGLLDRLDAVFFTIVVGYYLSVGFVY